MLINDADWELLVSTSSDTLPQPLPSVGNAASVGKPWASDQSRSGLGNLSHSTPPPMGLFLSSISNKEGLSGCWGGRQGAHPSWRFESWMCKISIFLVRFFIHSQNSHLYVFLFPVPTSGNDLDHVLMVLVPLSCPRGSWTTSCKTRTASSSSPHCTAAEGSLCEPKHLCEGSPGQPHLSLGPASSPQFPLAASSSAVPLSSL